MTNHCETCKHWTPPNPKPDWDGTVKVVGNCDSDRFQYQDDSLVDGLSYWDYEGYSAGFNTGPKFGCVHWKANADAMKAS